MGMPLVRAINDALRLNRINHEEQHKELNESFLSILRQSHTRSPTDESGSSTELPTV